MKNSEVYINYFILEKVGVLVRKTGELDKIRAAKEVTTNYDSGNFEGFLIASGQMRIQIFVGSLTAHSKVELTAAVNGISEEKIWLSHGIDLNLSIRKFVVGTTDAERAMYSKLIDATDKWVVFIEVWDYFEKKSSAEVLERLKTDFLYHIYNGKTPSSFTKSGEIPELESFKSLYQSFEKPVYQKQLDLDAEEAQGADQRRELSLLRDALLAKK